VAVSIRQYNTQIYITQNNTTKKQTNKKPNKKQIDSESYTSSEGHITAPDTA
jgi:hypothetical protein